MVNPFQRPCPCPCHESDCHSCLLAVEVAGEVVHHSHRSSRHQTHEGTAQVESVYGLETEPGQPHESSQSRETDLMRPKSIAVVPGQDACAQEVENHGSRSRTCRPH